MDRAAKAKNFWGKQNPLLSSMYLNAAAAARHEEEQAEIIGYLPDVTGKRVLDLGAGIGRFTRLFSEKADKVVSVEVVEQFYNANRTRNQDRHNVEFLLSDVMDLRFEPGQFDLIFINWLLMYLENDEIDVLVRRMAAWLPLRGYLFVRETCGRMYRHPPGEYYVHYRTLAFYDHMFLRDFKRVKSGAIEVYRQHLGSLNQRYWLLQKRPSPVPIIVTP